MAFSGSKSVAAVVVALMTTAAMTTAASAVPYNFAVTSVNGLGDNFLNYSFTIDSDPMPNATDDGLRSFTVDNVVTTGQRTNFGPYTTSYSWTFYEASTGGGLDNGFPDNTYFSDQLFTVSYLDPTFRTGTFNLYEDFNGGNKVATLVISGPAVTAVPEPATWALMLAGFGLTGLVVRRRRMQAAGV